MLLEFTMLLSESSPSKLPLNFLSFLQVNKPITDIHHLSLLLHFLMLEEGFQAEKSEIIISNCMRKKFNLTHGPVFYFKSSIMLFLRRKSRGVYEAKALLVDRKKDEFKMEIEIERFVENDVICNIYNLSYESRFKNISELSISFKSQIVYPLLLKIKCFLELSTSRRSLDILNDDCLFTLFKLLDVVSFLRLSNTSKRFLGISRTNTIQITIWKKHMKSHFPIQYRMIESGNKGEIIKAFFIMLYKNKTEKNETRRRASRDSSMSRDVLDVRCRYMFGHRCRDSLDFYSSYDLDDFD